jgi:peptide-methionine (R)-S-oxide reductase
MTRRTFLGTGLSLLGGGLLGGGLMARHVAAAAPAATAGGFPVMRAEAEWKQTLSPSQYYILREHGTEPPGSSPLNGEKRAGTFNCAGCDLPLFSSATKFDSGTGWPSFWQPLPEAVGTATDTSLFMQRVEVHCARCGGHLGHVFEDGPRPTGLRYCMNGAAMVFTPKAAAS